MKQGPGNIRGVALYGKHFSQEMWNNADYSLNCDEEFRELSNAAALQELYDSETEKEIWIRKLLPSSRELENGKHEFLGNSCEYPQNIVDSDSTRKLEKITQDSDNSNSQLVKLDGLQSLIESSSTWDTEDRKTYSEFLLSLYAPEEREYAPEESSDEDFDYLLEAQNETEDEEEYRNDPTARISGKELVDLVSGKSSYSFRNKKHSYMKNNVSKRKPRVDVNQIEKQPVDSTGNESMSSKSHRAKPIMPAVVDARMLQSNYSRPQFYFRKDSLEQISLQMNRHIQVLIQTCLLVGQERLKDVVALNHARRLLSEWKRASDICINYQRFFTESILDLEPNITEDSCSVSVFDTPLLRIIPELLLFTETHDCLQSSDVHKLFEKFSPFFEEELLPKLPKYNFFVHTKHSILDAEYIDVEQIKSVVCSEEKWSDAEDALIAKLIREYGSDWLDNYEKLLPSKQYDEVWRRYRFLSGRHAPDNPVKRLVMERQKPLSSEEWRILEHGVYLYGDNAWKQIETNLLPHRDQIILQRMWKQRQKRRRQKIRENERHKQEARKLARRLRQQREDQQQESKEQSYLKQTDNEEAHKETNTSQVEVDNHGNWLTVSGDFRVHFSHEDDKKLLSQVKISGATENTFLELAKTLGDGKTPEIIRKRYLQLLWWLQQSSQTICPSKDSSNCETSVT